MKSPFYFELKCKIIEIFTNITTVVHTAERYAYNNILIHFKIVGIIKFTINVRI